MKILGLDSSGIVASVAIVEDDVLIAEYTVNYKKTHSQTLLPMLDEIAKMTALKDYLTETDIYELNKLYPYADNILNMLYEYEWNYDEAQWSNWDNTYLMILDFIEEEK